MESEENVDNDLSEFGVDSNAPDLFENNISEQNSEIIEDDQDNNSEEEEFEIPAFLRRQKN